MRRILLLSAALALTIAACGGDTATTTTAAINTTTTGASSSSTDTVTPPESTTSSGTSTEPAGLAITEINLLDGTVTVTNLGEDPASLDGHAICQRPNYSFFDGVTLDPGESVEVEASKIGGFDPETGEVGLYSSGQFDDSTSILSYVEWGRGGHGRSSVAVAAGIWPADGFVATSADTELLTTNGEIALSPDEWVVG